MRRVTVLAELAEERGHVGGGVLVRAVQPDEGVEEQQPRAQAFEGGVEAGAVERAVETQGGDGEQKPIEVGEAQVSRPGDRKQPVAQLLRAVLGAVGEHWTRAFHGDESAVAGKEFLLRDAIASIPDDRHDYVVFDCPPSLNLLTASALGASDFMLVPVGAKFMSLRPLAPLMKLFDGVQRRLNPDLRLAGVMGCKVQARSRHFAEIVERMRQAFCDAVFSTMIRDAIRLGEAPGQQKTNGLFDPSGNAADDDRAFAEEFEQRMKALSRKRRVANA
jgi:hypothetical protein